MFVFLCWRVCSNSGCSCNNCLLSYYYWLCWLALFVIAAQLYLLSSRSSGAGVLLLAFRSSTNNNNNVSNWCDPDIQTNKNRMIQPLSSRRCCVGPLLLALLLLLLLPMIISAWVSLPTSNTFSTMQRSCATNTMAATTRWRVFGRTAIAATETDDFASFAATLEQDAVKQQQQQRPASSSTTRTTWQEDLERVLDPTTSNAQRQILVSDLLQSTEKTADIRASVQTALRDRKVRSCVCVCGIANVRAFVGTRDTAWNEWIV